MSNKRLISMLLTVAMIFTFIPATAVSVTAADVAVGTDVLADATVSAVGTAVNVEDGNKHLHVTNRQNSGNDAFQFDVNETFKEGQVYYMSFDIRGSFANTQQRMVANQNGQSLELNGTWTMKSNGSNWKNDGTDYHKSFTATCGGGLSLWTPTNVLKDDYIYPISAKNSNNKATPVSVGHYGTYANKTDINGGLNDDGYIGMIFGDVKTTWTHVELAYVPATDLTSMNIRLNRGASSGYGSPNDVDNIKIWCYEYTEDQDGNRTYATEENVIYEDDFEGYENTTAMNAVYRKYGTNPIVVLETEKDSTIYPANTGSVKYSGVTLDPGVYELGGEIRVGALAGNTDISTTNTTGSVSYTLAGASAVSENIAYNAQWTVLPALKIAVDNETALSELAINFGTTAAVQTRNITLTKTEAFSEAPVTLTVDAPDSADAGEQFTVDVIAYSDRAAAQKLNALNFVVVYDDDALKLDGIALADGVKGDYVTNKASFGWNGGATGFISVDADGAAVATVTFTVLDAAKAGDTDITLGASENGTKLNAKLLGVDTTFTPVATKDTVEIVNTVKVTFSADPEDGADIDGDTELTADVGSVITIDGDVITVNGEEVAVLPDGNYELAEVKLNGNTVSGDITVGTDDLAFVFVLKLKKNDLIFTAENGSVTPIFAEVDAGATVKADGLTLTVGGNVIATAAPANDNYKFLGWSIDGSVDTFTEATLDYAENGYGFVARFTHKTVNVTFGADENGSVAPSSEVILVGKSITAENNTLKIGDKVIATATANEYYRFKGWKLNGTDFTGSETIAENGTYAFIAEFENITVEIAVGADENGSVDKTAVTVNVGDTITADGATLKIGDDVIATATPNTNYEFDCWSLRYLEFSSITVEEGETYVFKAQFKKIPVDISFSADANGTVAPTSAEIEAGDKIVTDGEKLMIGSETIAAAAPNTNYKFVGWYLNGSGDKFAEVTVEANTAYAFVAKFEIITVNVTFAADESGNVDKIAATVNAGDSITVNGNVITVGDVSVTATPANADYKFKGWYLNNAAIPADAKIEADGTYVFTAEFEIVTKEISFTAELGGSVDKSSVTADAGTTVVVNNAVITVNGTAVTATPETGYTFAAWTINNNPISNGSFVISADREYAFTATFKLESSNVTFSAVNGTVDKTEVAANVTDTVTVSGNTVTIGVTTVTAAPTNANYEFKGWFLNDQPYTGGTIEADITYAFVARYELIKVEATFAADANGSVSVQSATVNAGDAIAVNGNVLTVGGTTVSATANANYKFKGWRLNGADITATVVAPTGAYAFTAEFEPITVGATFAAEANGAVNVTSATADAGTAITVDGNKLTFGDTTVMADSNPNYKFVGWYLNGTAFTGGTVAVDCTYAFTAKFELNTVDVTITAGENGSVDKTTAKANAGQTITADGASLKVDGTVIATATADAGYKLDGWYFKNALFTSTPVTADGSYHFAATFVKDTFEMTVPEGVSVTVNGGTPVEGGENVKVNVQIGDAVVITPNSDAMVIGVAYNGNPITAVDGKYTVPANEITEAVEITVTALEYSFITAKQYRALASDDYKILVLPTDANDTDYTLGDTEFYYSSKYEAYVAIIDAELTASEIGQTITSKAGSETAVAYNGDVNGDGDVTAADAAIISEILHAYNNGTTVYTDLERFEADVFGEYTEGSAYVTTADCSWTLYKSVGLDYPQN